MRAERLAPAEGGQRADGHSRPRRSSSSAPHRPANALLPGSAFQTAAAMPHTCATAPEVVFETLEELKAHYHTDWHRYNLKRKVRRLWAGPRLLSVWWRRPWDLA